MLASAQMTGRPGHFTTLSNAILLDTARPQGGIVGQRSPYSILGGSMPAYATRPGRVMLPPNAGVDWNAQQLAYERAQQQQMLEIQAQLQMQREKAALELALANQRAGASWAEGGREMQWRSGESAAERAARQAMANTEYGFRGQQAGLDRQHDVRMAGIGEETELRRLAAAHGYDLERMDIGQQYAVLNQLAQQQFQGGESQLDRLQRERLAEMAHAQELERMGVGQGYTLDRDKLQASLLADRDAVLHGYGREDMGLGHQQTLERMGVGQGYNVDQMRLQEELRRGGRAEEFGYEQQMATMQNDLSLGRAQTLMGDEYDLRAKAGHAENLERGVDARESLALSNDLTKDGAKLWSGLSKELQVIRSKRGELLPAAYEEAMRQWVAKFDSSRIQKHMKASQSQLDQLKDIGTLVDKDGFLLDYDDFRNRKAGAAGGIIEGRPFTFGVGGRAGEQPATKVRSTFQDVLLNDRAKADAFMKAAETSLTANSKEGDAFVPSREKVLEEAAKMYEAEQDFIFGKKQEETGSVVDEPGVKAAIEAVRRQAEEAGASEEEAKKAADKAAETAKKEPGMFRRFAEWLGRGFTSAHADNVKAASQGNAMFSDGSQRTSRDEAAQALRDRMQNLQAVRERQPGTSQQQQAQGAAVRRTPLSGFEESTATAIRNAGADGWDSYWNGESHLPIVRSAKELEMFPEGTKVIAVDSNGQMYPVEGTGPAKKPAARLVSPRRSVSSSVMPGL
jgi:hypothetical protein